MKTLNLRRVSDDIYEDDSMPSYKRWTKGFRMLSLDLSELVAVQGVEVSFHNLQEGFGDPLGNTETRLAGALLRMGTGEAVGHKRMTDLRAIHARGEIAADDGDLRLINPLEGEKDRFNEISVTLRPVNWNTVGDQEDADQWEKLLGRWGHFASDSETVTGQLWLDLPVPETWFRPVWSRIALRRSVGQLNVDVLAQAFESEFSRNVREFGHIELAFERDFMATAVIRRFVAAVHLEKRSVDDTQRKARSPL